MRICFRATVSDQPGSSHGRSQSIKRRLHAVHYTVKLNSVFPVHYFAFSTQLETSRFFTTRSHPHPEWSDPEHLCYVLYKNREQPTRRRNPTRKYVESAVWNLQWYNKISYLYLLKLFDLYFYVICSFKNKSSTAFLIYAVCFEVYECCNKNITVNMVDYGNCLT